MGNFKRDDAVLGITDKEFCRAVRRCLLADVEEDRKKKEKKREKSRRNRGCGCCKKF